MERTLAKRQSSKRGWLTYTELVHLMPSFSLAKQVLNATAVLALSYAAGVMTIATGFLLASQVPGNALSSNTSSNANATQTAAATTETVTLDNSQQQQQQTDTLDILMEDLTESIEQFDAENLNEEQEEKCFNRVKWSKSIPNNDCMTYLNELLHSKCTYGSNVGTSTGTLLTNYLNGGEVKRNESQLNCTNSFNFIFEHLPKTQQAKKPSFLFPTLWFKFM